MTAILDTPITNKNFVVAQQDAKRLSLITDADFAVVYRPSIDSFAAVPAPTAIELGERIVTFVSCKASQVQVELKMAIIPEGDRLGFKARVRKPVPTKWSDPEDEQEDAIASALTRAGIDPQTKPSYELIVTHIANEAP